MVLAGHPRPRKTRLSMLWFELWLVALCMKLRWETFFAKRTVSKKPYESRQRSQRSRQVFRLKLLEVCALLSLFGKEVLCNWSERLTKNLNSSVLIKNIGLERNAVQGHGFYSHHFFQPVIVWKSEHVLQVVDICSRRHFTFPLILSRLTPGADTRARRRSATELHARSDK